MCTSLGRFPRRKCAAEGLDAPREVLGKDVEGNRKARTNQILSAINDSVRYTWQLGMVLHYFV